ncbi:hypothetical protein ACVIQT_001116 [Bradyrhizobium diazoefficiens]
MQAADASEQVRKALEIAGLLELGAAHHRWEAQRFGAGFAMAGDQRGEPLDDALIERGAGVDTVRAHAVEQLVGEMIERIGDLRRGVRRVGENSNVHVRLPAI